MRVHIAQRVSRLAAFGWTMPISIVYLFVLSILLVWHYFCEFLPFSQPESELINKRVVLFSYGSGLASSMFSLTVCPEPHLRAAFSRMRTSLLEVKHRLSLRIEVTPQTYVEILKTREQHCHAADYCPKCSSDELFPGTYYLDRVDEKFRRFYKKKSTDIMTNGVD